MPKKLLDGIGLVVVWVIGIMSSEKFMNLWLAKRVTRARMGVVFAVWTSLIARLSRN